jgi:hypothetical protein
MADRKWRSLSAALGLLGFLAAGPNAFATWYAANTGEKMTPLASIPVGPRGTVFAVDTTVGMLYEVWYQSAQWNFSPVYWLPQAQAFAASATISQNALGPVYDTYYVAHCDNDGQVRLSSWEPANLFGGWTTQIVDAGTAAVATVMFQDALYIFYTSSNGTWDTLKYAIYNGSSIKTYTIDGDGKLPGSVVGNLYQPAAVPATDGLHVYYHDNSNGTLREAASTSGVNWTFKTIDGPGGVPGSTADAVGILPAAIVFKNGNTETINVFYTDSRVSKLRVAQRSMGTWSFSFVDDIDIQSTKAPVIYGTTQMDVFYESGFKTSSQLRAAYGTGPNALNLGVVDGSGGMNGQVGDGMGPQVTAVEVKGAGPSVFYRDPTTNMMRNSYWK